VIITEIDLNCDLGEVPGPMGRHQDAELLRCISSANVACGGHAGDEQSMRQTVVAASSLAVAVGAHPSYPDRPNFGRKSLGISAFGLGESIEYQIRSLRRIAAEAGVALVHVKPHGALYNEAANSSEIAHVVCQAIEAVDRNLFVVGRSGGILLDVARQFGLKTLSEVFADRNYLPDASLVPRTSPDAIVSDPQVAAVRVAGMIRDGKVLAVDGTVIGVNAQTVGVHSDQPGAVEFCRTLVEKLRDWSLVVRRAVSNG
jgi:UPF0271 protein